MAAETSNDVDVAAETSNDETILSSAEPKNGEWVIKIMTEHRRMDQRKREQQTPKRIRMVNKTLRRTQKVDKTLLQTDSNNHWFEPSVVSFGPFHHGEGSMEPYKNVAAAWFFSHAKQKPADKVTDDEDKVTDAEAISVYEKFIKEVENVSPTDWYDEHEFKFDSKEDFIRMMFLDGCFILYFIYFVVTGLSSDNEYNIFKRSRQHFNQASIVRDMFLLENQIPFPILKSLMRLLPHQEVKEFSIIKFIFMVFLPSYVTDFSRNISRSGGFWRMMIWISKLFVPSVWDTIFQSLWTRLFSDGREPLHLLHVLREVLLGVPDSPDSAGGSDSPDSAGGSAGYWNYYFRPIRQLKAAGIQVRRSRGMTLKHLKFEQGLLNSHLEIPRMIVDGSTMTRLLNLAAYEMCPDGPEDRTVTSYICLLDSLIDHAEDVNELQSEKILLNNLGSGEVVSNLFKELAANLSPDSDAYAHVIKGIKKHHERHLYYERSRIGRWIHQFKCTYFTSPWTLISLIAAVFMVALTLLQTIYTMWAFYKSY